MGTIGFGLLVVRARHETMQSGVNDDCRTQSSDYACQGVQSPKSPFLSHNKIPEVTSL